MSRIKFNILLLCILVSQVYPQVGLQITQNTNIANGEQTTSLFSTTTTDYKINENLFDINATYKNFYIYFDSFKSFSLLTVLEIIIALKALLL